MLAVVVGAGSWVAAAARPVPRWEVDLTVRLNDLPGWVAAVLWPVMQVGSLFGPVVAALVVLVVRRDRVLAGCLAVGGLATWYLAKAAKEAVGRGRPFAYTGRIDVRGPAPDGYGYPSGHAAVSMFTAVVLMAAVPRRVRPWLLLVPLLVGAARLVVGVHLPVDVVGGWALGALVGLAAVEVADRLRIRRGPVDDRTAG